MKNIFKSILVAAPLFLMACGGGNRAECARDKQAACEHCKHGEQGDKGHCEHCKHGEKHGDGPCEHCKHGEHGPGGEHGKGEHGPMLPPQLTAIHDVLAPIWHSEPGAVRVGKACDGAKALAESGKAAADVDFLKGVAALDVACAAPGRGDVEVRLGVVHERFHALVEASKPH